VLGWLPGGDKYAILFGAWVAVTELIPYIGPWLGAIPPLLYALVVHPVSAIWVALLFLAIHQIEGHIVVPNVMGSALRLHPLLVIFGLLAGGEIYGLPGVFVALPFLAAAPRDLGVLLGAHEARALAGRSRRAGAGRRRAGGAGAETAAGAGAREGRASGCRNSLTDLPFLVARGVSRASACRSRWSRPT
jgi:hypothetical protein